MWTETAKDKETIRKEKSVSNRVSEMEWYFFFVSTRVVPKVISNFFLHANWEEQTRDSVVVDGTSCCVIHECLVTSIACIT